MFYLKSIWIDGLLANVKLNPDGTNNLSSLASGNAAAPASAPAPAATSTPAPAAGTITQPAMPVAGPSTAKPPMDFQLESFVLTKSGVNLQDNSGRDSCDGRRWMRSRSGVKNLRTLGKSPATFYVNANIHSGGALAVNGALDLRNRRLPATCRSTRSICRRCSRSRRSSWRRRWRRASSARRPTCRPISRAATSTCMRSRRASRLKISKSTRRMKKKSRCSGKISASRSDSSIWRRVRPRLPKSRATGCICIVRRERDGKLSLESLMRGTIPPPAERVATDAASATRASARERSAGERSANQ